MNDLQKLLTGKYSSRNADILAQFLFENPEYLNDFIKNLFSKDLIVSKNAAWALSKANESTCLELFNYVDRIIEELTDKHHISVKRASLKILSQLTDNNLKVSFRDNQIDKIIELCFDFLLDHKNPPAIRVYSIYTLNNLSHLRPWVKGELKNYLSNNYNSEKASFKAAARKVLGA